MKKNRNKLLWVLLTLVLFTNIQAQDTLKNKVHSLTLKTQFFQLKEGFNYGLIFSCLNLCVRYALEKSFSTSIITYTPELGFGASYNSKAGLGMAWQLSPMDFYYGIEMNQSREKAFFLGPYLSTNYSWQLYPELQSGHMFWFTSMEIGAQFMAKMNILNKTFQIKVSNSLAGLTSHSKPITETYLYSLTFSDFVSNAHSDMEVSTLNKFTHSSVVLELLNSSKKRLTLAYEFEYVGYFKELKFEMLAHSLNLNWKIGNF